MQLKGLLSNMMLAVSFNFLFTNQHCAGHVTNVAGWLNKASN
jgi:hypothetical protein